MSVRNELEQVRRLVPLPVARRLVARRVERLWQDPVYVQHVEGEMALVVGATDRAPEVPTLARGYAEHMLLRAYLRWHPRVITRQRVEGVEWLTIRRDLSRGVLINFMHHHQYDGMFASLRHAGVAPINVVAAPELMQRQAGAIWRQHTKIVGMGGPLIPSDVGSDGLAACLAPGQMLGIASDFPGRTPVTFLGRRVLGPFGAARLATKTDSPVVLVTAERDGQGPYLQVHEPLEPSTYPDPGDLLDDLLERHGRAVLAWPEAFEAPGGRFGVVPDGDASAVS